VLRVRAARFTFEAGAEDSPATEEANLQPDNPIQPNFKKGKIYGKK
jgi:hypothetical protein